MPFSVWSTFGSVAKAIVLLPQIFTILKELVALFKDQPKDKVKKISEQMKQVKRAKTPEEKKSAAKQVSKLISGL